jgi:hypothetical protein
MEIQGGGCVHGWCRFLPVVVTGCIVVDKVSRAVTDVLVVGVYNIVDIGNECGCRVHLNGLVLEDHVSSLGVYELVASKCVACGPEEYVSGCA